MTMKAHVLQLACFMALMHEILPLSNQGNDLTDHNELRGNRAGNGKGNGKGSRRHVDAEDSWMSFVRRSKRVQNGKQTDRKRKNKRTQRLIDSYPGCVPGPMGPRGPPGPPGPKGAHVTIDVLMEEFKDLVREASEKRANELLLLKCPECTDLVNITSQGYPYGIGLDMTWVPKLTSGFHMKLRKNALVTGKTLKELDSFHQPFAAGAFHRGNSFNVREGRFTAPVTGIYQFSLNLHIRVKTKRRVKIRRKDVVKAMICIDSLCQHNSSLQHLVGLESSSRVFTTSFSGFLELQMGQYASVYVDNASNINVVVKSQSDFSGVLIGT